MFFEGSALQFVTAEVGSSLYHDISYLCRYTNHFNLAADPLEILQQYWDFPSFRPLQEDIIRSVLEGKDTLGLMPTGGGKSICFQVPALCQEGICMVVSPLIALMKDQVYHLGERGIPAAAIFSGMSYRDIDRTFDNCVYGNVKLLYLSPERLKTEIAQARIAKMKVNLIAVDEAHCISQWGYDFRPAYLEVARIREILPNVPVLALTATATEKVVLDIQEKLEFPKLNVLQKSFDRSNLSYVVLQEDNKFGKLVEMLRKVAGSAIIYVRSRRKAREVAQYLRHQRISADFYHAGLSPDVRSKKQEQWIHNKFRVMASTNAFGMGIDKPDVRLVIHIDMPNSLEAYFQEAGRAGRDGKKAYAALLYNRQDRQQLEKQFKEAYPPFEEVRRVYRALGSYFQLATGSGQGESYDFDIVDFSSTFQLAVTTVFHCLKILEQAGWIVLTEAVFTPSQLKVRVEKDALYDFQLKHPKLDRVLKIILRTYQGAFNQYVNLREQQLAKFLKIPTAEIIQALELLHREQIVFYQPAKDKPQLIFLQERVDADHLSIDHQHFQFRKKRHQEKMEAALTYAETAVCRNRQLLQYFGEEKTENCGRCDVCLGRTKKDLDNESFERLKIKIKRLLQKGPLRTEEVVESFSPKWEDKVLQSLQYMIDEGMVERKEGKLFWML